MCHVRNRVGTSKATRAQLGHFFLDESPYASNFAVTGKSEGTETRKLHKRPALGIVLVPKRSADLAPNYPIAGTRVQ